MINSQLSLAQRLISFAGAIVIALVLYSGAAASAQTRTGGYYSATLVAPASTGRTVAGSVVWTCDGAACSAPRGTSRPAIICARLAREVGRVESFSANGQQLESADLERCNAAAR